MLWRILRSVEVHLGPGAGLFAWVIPTDRGDGPHRPMRARAGMRSSAGFLENGCDKKKDSGIGNGHERGRSAPGPACRYGRRGPAGRGRRSRPGQAHLWRRHLSGSCRCQDRGRRGGGCGNGGRQLRRSASWSTTGSGGRHWAGSWRSA